MDTQGHDNFVIIHSPAKIESKQGLPYFVGVSGHNAGARGISMNMVVIPAGGAGQPHCHSNFESTIYLVKGRVLTKYGEGLANEAITEAGDFLYIGPNVWHQPINLSETEDAIAIVARNDPEEQEHVILYEGEMKGAA